MGRCQCVASIRASSTGMACGEASPAFGGAVVGAAGQPDQHPVVFQHHLRDGQGQFGVSVAAAGGDVKGELGGLVEVAQPAPAGAPENEIGDAVLLGTDRRLGRIILQVGEEFGQRPLRLGGETQPRGCGGGTSVHFRSPNPLTCEVEHWHSNKLIS